MSATLFTQAILSQSIPAWPFEVPPGWMLRIHPCAASSSNMGSRRFQAWSTWRLRGSVRILLESADDHEYTLPLRINPGDRVAQASLVPSPRVTFTVVEQPSLTERGEGGFGRTGEA